jgi:hypothetical protein
VFGELVRMGKWENGCMARRLWDTPLLSRLGNTLETGYWV